MNLDRFVQVPFASKGRDYDGADCWGLVYLYYRDVMKIHLETYADIPATSLRTVSQMITAYKQDWIVADKPRDGDVVVMRALTHRSKIEDAHVGIVAGKRFVLHTEDGVGAKLERLSDPHVKSRIVDIRRHPLAA